MASKRFDEGKRRGEGSAELFGYKYMTRTESIGGGLGSCGAERIFGAASF